MRETYPETVELSDSDARLLRDISDSIDAANLPQRDRERAWDAYAAAFIAGHGGYPGDAATAAVTADALLAERDKRFGVEAAGDE